MTLSNKKIAVVGLGYVGLPLAVELAKHYTTFGYDHQPRRINKLQELLSAAASDPTVYAAAEGLSNADLIAAKKLQISSESSVLANCNIIIVCVPTPVNASNIPDMSALTSASETIGKNFKPGTTIIYESTVYPGATEEVCIPILEKHSAMRWKKDFFVGYSPERINPGDMVHTITNTTKIIAGDTAETVELLDQVYSSFIAAGTHRVSSIQVAEATKVIENTQRDLNIALINELSIIFSQLDIDTDEVLQAAKTKWNFHSFTPGLVGGHCIGVDPYYLTYKAEMMGYHPEIILAGRRINDDMVSYVAKMTVRAIMRQGGCSPGDTVIVFGLTFKENCPDIRNSKAAVLVKQLQGFSLNVAVHDPLAEPEETEEIHDIKLSSWEKLPRNVNAVLFAVSHDEYRNLPLEKILGLLRPCGVFVDLKSIYDADTIRNAGHYLWRL